MIAQIWAESQFSPEFGHTNPSATRCYLADKPKDPNPAPLCKDEPGEKYKSQGLATVMAGRNSPTSGTFPRF